MNLGDRIRAAAGTLFGFPRVSDGVVPNYPESMVGAPWRLDALALDYPKAMRKVAMVRRCVLRVANDLARLPIVFETLGADGEYVPIPRKSGNIVDVWTSANSEQTGFEVIRDVHAASKASGSAYLVMEDFGTSRVQEIWTLHPQYVRPIVGDRRELKAYVFNRGGREEAIPAANVIFWKGYNPDFEPSGASDLESIELDYATNYDVSRLLQKFVRGGGMPAGYWSVQNPSGKGQVALTEPEKKRMKAMLDKLYAGIRQAFQAHIVGDLKFERAGLTPDEMKLLDIAKLTDERICLAIGVPPWMMGIKGGNSGVGDKGGSASADIGIYWENTLLPEVALRDAILTEKFCPRFGTGIRARTDLSQVAALNETLLRNANNVASLCGTPPYSVNEVRAMNGAPARKEPEADALYQKPDPVAPVVNAAPSGADAGKQAPTDAPAQKSRMLDGDTNREQRRRHAKNNLARYERKLQSAFAGILARKKDKLCKAIEREASRGKVTRALNLDELMMPDPEDEDAVRSILAALVADRGEEALADLALELELAFNAQRTSGWVRDTTYRVLTQTSETEKEAVRGAIEKSMSLNESLSALVERIRALPEFDSARAVLIARTESTGAYNYASREGWAQSGVVDQQEWLSARDDSVRDTHAEADGQVVALGDAFDVGGSPMEYPGDPMGGPEEVCNCRCTLLPVVNEQARAKKQFDAYLARVLRGSKRAEVVA